MLDSFVCAWVLSENGSARELTAEEAAKYKGDDLLWIHLDRTKEGAMTDWPQVKSLSEDVLDSLFAELTRPRCEEFNEGYLINLRGVNLNPGNDPVDMIATRIWIGEKVIISLRRMPMLAFNDMRRSLSEGKQIRNKGDFIAFVADRLTERISPVVEKSDQIALELEDKDLLSIDDEESIESEQQNLARLNRYFLPQQQALLKLSQLSWLSKKQAVNIRGSLDSMTLYLEELAELKERFQILANKYDKQTSAKIERTMHLLSVITGIFLPLGFLTGLLGINVGGMPGVENANAFWIVTLIIFVIGVLQYLYFKFRKII